VDKYLFEEKVASSVEMKIYDLKKMTKSEKMHSPTIKIFPESIDKRGTLLVEVSTGSYGLIHRTSKKHFIKDISLSVNGKIAGKVELLADVSRGFIALRIKETELENIEASSVCNLHGTWRTKLKKVNGKWENLRV